MATRNFDLASSAQKHVMHHVTHYGKDYELTDIASGTGMTIQLNQVKKTNTDDFHGNSTVFDTEQKTAKVTFTVIQNKMQDKRFQAEYDEQVDDDGDTFTYYDSLTGERITMTGCVIEGQPQTNMTNNVSTIQWVFLVAKLQRTFDDVSTINDAI